MQPNEMFILIPLFCPSLTDEGWGGGGRGSEEENKFHFGFSGLAKGKGIKTNV